MIRLIGIYFKYFFKRLIFIAFWICLLMLFFVLQPNDILYINLNDYINPGYQLSGLETWMYVIHVFIVIFLILIAVETLYIIFYNWYKQLSQRQKQRIYSRMQNELFSFLKGDTNDINQSKVFGLFSGAFYTEQKMLFFVDGLREVELLTKGVVHERCLSVFVVIRVKKLIWSYMYSPYSKHRTYAMRTIGEDRKSVV